MKYSYENQDAATFLVCELEEGEQVDELGQGMLGNNQISGILPVAFLQVDEKKYFRVNVSSKVQLESLLSGKVNRVKLLNILEGICEAYIGIKDYFLDSAQLLSDPKYVFCEVSTGKTSMVYMPVLTDSNDGQDDFTAFVKNIIFGTTFAQESNMDYVPRLMNFLNSKKTLDAKEFLAFVKELWNPSENSRMDHKPEPIMYPDKNSQTERNNGAYRDTYQNDTGNGYRQSGQGASYSGYTASSAQQGYSNYGIQGQTYSGIDSPNLQNNGYGNGLQNNAYQGMSYPNAFGGAYTQGGSPNNQSESQQPVKEKKKKKRGLFSFGRKKDEEAQENTKAGFNIPQSPAPVSFFGQKSDAPYSVGHMNAPGQQPYQTQQSFQNQQPYTGQQQGAGGSYSQYGQYQQNNGNQPFRRPEQHSVYQNRSTDNQHTASSNTGYQKNNYAAIAAAAGDGTTFLNVKNTSDATTYLSPDMLNGLRKSTATLRRERTGEVVSINQDVFHIGKDRSYVHYFISDNPGISRSHADIIRRDGKYYVRDTNSMNHTCLNNEMLTSNTEYELRNGDDLLFADEHFEFRVR